MPSTEEILQNNTTDVQQPNENLICPNTHIDSQFYDNLNDLFDTYFIDLEEQQRLEEEQQKLEEEKQKEQELLNEELQYNSQEFQTQLLTEIKVLQEYQQYENNLIFFGILIALVIFVSTLIYKFFKIFI